MARCELLLEEAQLGSVSRLFKFVAFLTVMCSLAVAQETPRMSLEYGESMFAVMAAINTCGYDQDLGESLPMRARVRDAVVKNAQGIDAQNAIERMCRFYSDHQQPDASRTLAQYVSLALNLGEPPAFAPKIKEAELPPDAAYVQGFVPLLQNFYITTQLGKIYQQEKASYEQVIQKFHEPVSNLLVSTDIYLKRPLSGYVGRNFLIYLEPLAAPGQSNSRNYGEDYYMVLSPGDKGIRLDQVRHTYLHFILDPLTQKRANAVQKLAPLLHTVQNAPLDESYKQDVTLLVTESLIRAIEARTVGGRKGPEPPRQQAVDASMREGFILTRYFYDALVKFEGDEVGLRDALPDWLFYVNVRDIQKQAERIQFASSAPTESLRASRKQLSMNEMAERALASGNFDAATNYANDALRREEDAGRANFILARAASLQGKMKAAMGYFERTLETSKDTRILGWSHIYLGRIYDLQGERPTALQHYRGALEAGDSPEIKAAAQRGLEKAYEPPNRTE